jgi:DNA polymerase-3 subunit epsilon
MKHLELDGRVILEKLTDLASPDREPIDGDVPAVILDVETTGLNHEKDEIIQIALRPFFVNPTTGEVSGIKKPVTFLQQPSKPLPSIITEITGFHDEDLEGHEIPWPKISKILNYCQFIIAHNASFDRKWIDRVLRLNGCPPPSGAIWGCSMSQVEWRGICRPSKALEVLCAWHGFFYDSHNALADVDATLHLLRMNSYMKELVNNAVSSDYHVFPVGSERDENPLLKSRGYRWNPDLTTWWVSTASQQKAEEECEWLVANLRKVDPQYFEIEPQHRFSE